MRAIRLVDHAICAALFAAPAVAAPTYTLVNALGSDQTMERVTVEIDGRAVGAITVDAKNGDASLTLPLTRDVQRYRLTGETMLDGEKYKITGEGLLVSTARLDEIAEAPRTTADAIVAYEKFLAELKAAAPSADLAGVTLVREKPVDAAAVRAAEKRLSIDLPAGYERLVTTVGPFRFADPNLDRDGILPPAELANAADFAVRVQRANGWTDGLDDMKKRIEKRYPKAKQDVVFGTFELGEPMLFTNAKKCPAGEPAILLPTSDFDLLGTDPGDNAFMGLIDYEDDIMGEAECMDFDRLVAYSLHDQLIELGNDALFKLDAEGETIGFYRESVDAEAKTILMRFTSAD